MMGNFRSSLLPLIISDDVSWVWSLFVQLKVFGKRDQQTPLIGSTRPGLIHLIV